ncbi:transferrin-binding protein-like solute binding protein [Glaesserella sp.]|uniref:transferrin-binding protein-like solute binding protein n=1 Tax=Glaesserella sp. TaxID=2094731 RepID=UPI0035A040FA
MKRLVFFFPISLILALTACGGSGGGGNSAGTTVQPDTTSSTHANQTANNSSNSSTTSDAQNSGTTSGTTGTNDTPNTSTTDKSDDSVGQNGTSGTVNKTVSGHYNEFIQATPLDNIQPVQEIFSIGNTEHIDHLNLEGKTINLQPISDMHHSVKEFAEFPNIFVKVPNDGTDPSIIEKISDTKQIEELLVGMDLNYARYGVVSNALRGNRDSGIAATAFAQGYQTALEAMPNRGSVEYRGHALVHTPSGIQKPIPMGLSADFDRKMVLGEIDLSNFHSDYYALGSASVYADSTFAFYAKITGNTFQTEKRAPTPHDYVDTLDVSYLHETVAQGAFYGPNAEEVAGTFYNGVEGGAFGGKKVENGK